MKLFLIGLPGSGKTTLGKQLAEKLKIPFFDLDSEIEKLEKKTVQEIFAEKKEAYFREVESQVLKKFCLQENDFVMATGGGAPCFFGNMSLMNNSGKSIFLDVPSSQITERLKKTDLSKRPLFDKLNSQQLNEKIQELRSARIDFYKQATLIVSGSSVEEIIAALKN